MRRLPIRLLITGVLIGGSWLVYLVADFTSCSGPRAERWAKAFTERGDAAFADSALVTPSSTTSQYSDLSARAEARYKAQVAQSTPGCLDDLQVIAETFFFNDWGAYEAASQGNFDLAMAYEDEMFRTLDTFETEFNRLAAEYEWDLE
jgi:hypothetical protein